MVQQHPSFADFCFEDFACEMLLLLVSDVVNFGGGTLVTTLEVTVDPGIVVNMFTVGGVSGEAGYEGF